MKLATLLLSLLGVFTMAYLGAPKERPLTAYARSTTKSANSRIRVARRNRIASAVFRVGVAAGAGGAVLSFLQ